MPFHVANKDYDHLDQLTVREVGQFESSQLFAESFPIYEDIYGRTIIHLRKRYPCFDVYDQMYENRYYHWFFIKYEGGLALVYYDDGWDEFEITDDYINDEKSFHVTPDVYDQLEASGLME